MPDIRPIPAITYTLRSPDGEVTPFIAPPYDVLTRENKRAMLTAATRNIVAVDLPVPPGVDPEDVAYERSASTFDRWLDQKILSRRDQPALYIYQQTYRSPGSPGFPGSSPGSSHQAGTGEGDRGEGSGGAVMKRRGVFVNVAVTPFGRGKDGKGGVFPHEKTHAGPKIDRLKLMHATRAQLSPIFGLFNDPQDSLRGMIDTVIAGGDPDMRGTTGLDDVLHEVWTVPETSTINKFVEALSGKDIYIADGHHRYTTAMNYQQELVDKRGPLPADHPANYCMFVLVSMQDPGMIVLPTHRVLGGMADFSLERFTQLAEGRLKITRFDGNDLASLEAAVTDAGKGAMGLYDPRNPDHPYWIAAPAMDDPLGKTFPDRSKAWRDLDVAIVQHLIVEEICEKNFCPDGGKVAWKFPHSLDQVKADTNHKDFQLGVILQPTPLESVKLVCEAGEVMPQKSTFFYPKVATGLVMNPLE